MIRAAIVKAADRRDWSIPRLAARAKLHRAAVWRFIKAKRDLSSERIDRLFQALDLTLDPAGRSRPLRSVVAEAIAQAGESSRGLRRELGYDPARFLNGARDATSEHLAILARHLGLKVRPVRK